MEEAAPDEASFDDESIEADASDRPDAAVMRDENARMSPSAERMSRAASAICPSMRAA